MVAGERSLTLEESFVLSFTLHQPLLYCAVLGKLLNLSEPVIWTWKYHNNPCCKLLRIKRNIFSVILPCRGLHTDGGDSFGSS